MTDSFRLREALKGNEIEQFSKQIKNQQSNIRWKWAFRYQWILKKATYEHND